MSAFGSAYLFPFAPLVRRIAPILAAIPTQIVETSGLTYCIVSYIANPALTEPPGELIYN